ncbi:hypothetical protein ACFFGR_16800 [Arthrobacter liuii]|uniref:Uncharacterized protein n=1 Tax=Arthrobacter liuii TaxID=1476996 RepID=A0ABQ2AXC7_9MICC|nr:hypothetical protein [Arthrobacter liuii]GGI00965.1 hypothetical protein GCM10007170_39330 [Arthrobacter liuii]
MGTMIGAVHSMGGEPPRLERVLLPVRHEFEVTVPDGSVVRGYLTSYEVWDSFVRVNVTFIDRPLRSGQDDAVVLRLSDGTFAKMVHGNGGGSDRFSFMASAFARPLVAQTATLGLRRDWRRPSTPRIVQNPGGAMLPARDPNEEMVFTQIMDLPLP